MSGLTEFFVMQLSLVVIVLALHTYMGLHIIRRGIIFCDLVLAQLAAFGVMVGVALGLRYGAPGAYLCSFSFVVVGALLLAATRPRNRRIPQEAVIGVLYGMALTACLLLADRLPDGGMELRKILVGSMLWVSWPLVAVTAGAYLGLLLFHVAARRRIIRLTEAPDRLPHRLLWDFAFFLTQGLITMLIVPVAGVLLAYGFLMIPAAIGTLFSSGWKNAVLFGWGSGSVACALGIGCSYRFDWPYGPTLLLAMSVFFLGALLITGFRTPAARRKEGA